MPRGRPRKFDEDQALDGATRLFWQKGLSATSLDDLATAMQMNRPSIYNAFGNKEEIYRKSLARFCGQLDMAMTGLLESEPDIRKGLNAFFNQAIEVYKTEDLPMGCFMMCTAPSETFTNPEVAEDLQSVIQRVDKGFKTRIERAKSEDAVPSSLDAGMAAKLLQATLQSIALRARADESKQSLRRLARFSVDAALNVAGD